MASQKNSLKSRWLSLSMRYTRIGSSQSVHSDPLWQQAVWSSLPHDILRNVIGRIDTSHDTWPDRTNLLACAAVCRSWRRICFELVKPVQDSGLITFPSSLKQAGPRDGLMKCFIKRSKLTQTYYLYLSVNEDVVPENGKFLLAARKYHYGRHCEYIISKSKQNFSRSSRSCLAKLRANFVGTKYVIHEAEQTPATNGDLQSVPQSSTKLGLKFLSKKSSPKFSPTGNIVYKQNFGFQGPPRKIEVFMHNIPSSIFKEGENSNLVLENKIPRWHEQLQCWCLNFSGRVTIASVKNFQLLEKFNLDELGNDNDNIRDNIVFNRDPTVIMQFGKVAKNIFSMDYQYPLSALQAFAIALSSFDHKLATE